MSLFTQKKSEHKRRFKGRSFTQRCRKLLAAAVMLSITPVMAQYCSPAGLIPYSVCAGGSILNVSFHTINHSAGCISTPNASDYYKDLTSTVPAATLQIGNTYPLSVTHSVSWGGGAAVWIDYNKNEIFEAGERVLASTTTGTNQVLSGNIFIPPTALAGATRMRVVAKEGSVPNDPCNPNYYSEVEDYTVILSGGAGNNAAVKSYQPIPTFCSGAGVTKDVYVRVANSGINELYSLTLNWTLDGVAQPTIYFNSMLDTLNGTGPNDTLLQLGIISFPTSAAQTIKVWTAMPNNVADTTNFDDTLQFTLKPSVSGSFTIGDIGADFTSISQAVTALQAGICGPVEFTFTSASQVYNGPVNISGIPGASSTNTITFTGTDTAQTVITSSTLSTVTINAVDFVTFKNIQFRTTNTSGSTLLNITNGADSTKVINCEFLLPISSNSSFEHISVSSSSGVLFDSCFVKGGYTGMRFTGQSGSEDIRNVVSNSVFDSVYSEGLRVNSLSGFRVYKNSFRTIGNGTNTFPQAIFMMNCVSGYSVTKNQFYGSKGGMAIRSVWNTAADGRCVIANNMIQIGEGSNQTIGIQVAGENADIVYNSISVGSSEPNSNLCLSASLGGSISYVLNNVFKNPNVGSVFSVSATSLIMDNNCYYHNNAQNFPYNLNGTAFATLAQLKAAGTTNTASFEADPLFVSNTNLRSFNPLFNGKAMPFPSIDTDIDDSVRHITRPDIGVNEFTLPPQADAGIIAVITPSVPVTAGTTTDVSVVIQNLGVGDLTSAMVHYKSGSVTHSLLYSGALLEGETDTIHFLASNNLGLLIPSTGFSIEAWTTFPNSVQDVNTSNDSIKIDYCQPLSGVYSINPASSGVRNFTNFASAADALKCGGISSSVIFEIAAGTYTEKLIVPQVPGASALNNITFKSATGIPADVLLLDSSTHDTNNFVIMFAGTSHINVTDISIENKGVTFGRGIFFKVTSGVINNNIVIRNCNVTGTPATSNNVNKALIFGGAENNTNITIVNNRLNLGSAGVNVSGLPATFQYSQNIIVDSNTFTNNSYNGIVVSSRENVRISNNTVTSGSSSMANGIFIAATAGNVVVSRNKVSIVNGAGIYTYNNAYYNEPGTAFIRNNVIELTGTGSLAQQGVKITGGTKVEVYNNTVKLNSSSTGLNNAGLHIEGDISYNNLGNAASYGFKIVNNIVQTENGYPLSVYVGWGIPSHLIQISRNAITLLDNNIYHNNSGLNIASIINVDYDKADFELFKGAIGNQNDFSSRYLKVPFNTGTLKPLESDTIAWWINGRGMHIASVANDFTGAQRATTPSAGVPDIGAYEITPSVLPPLARAVPATPAAGITQSFIFMNDTVAKITYDQFAPVPSSAEVRQYVGEMPPLVSPNQYFMYNYISVEMPSGFYNYNVEMRYNDAWTGTMSVKEADLKMTGLDHNNTWTMIPSSTVDIVTNVINASYISGHSYIFTGTDLVDPLPVNLLSFTARKTGDQSVETKWNTASEKNASHFIVERSFDGERFEVAGKVTARNTASSYKFNDRFSEAKANYAYYRLISVDRDGAQSNSEVVKVKLADDSRAMSTLAPNPVNNVFNIALGEISTEAVSMVVYGLKGEVVMTKNFAAGTEISADASSLNPGLYFVKVSYGNVSETIKFVKQ